jgi:hypothetical protein
MSQAVNITETGLVKSTFGKIKSVIVNSHTSGTLKLWNTASENVPVPATATLTSTGALVAATHATNTLTSSGAMVAGTHPVSVLTGDAIVAGNIVVIGTTTYTYVSALTGAYQVLVGADLTASLANLVAAINEATGKGATYGYGTVKHTQVVAVTSDATTVTVRGRVPGTSLNTVATTGTALRTVWADTTLGGGTGASDAGVTTGAATVTIGTTVYTVVDALSETYGANAIPYQVLKGASEATMLDNLKSAINATAGAGTTYSTGTVAHPDVVATTNADTTQIIRGRVPGISLNALATTETMANTSWADTTLGGGTGASDPGVTTAGATFTIGSRTYTAVIELSETLGAAAIPDQILWVTSEAVFLDNVKLAINASGTAGTDYSTGTTRHAQVKATTNANDSQVFVARVAGSSGNSIATTDTLANYAFGGTTMVSGTGSDGSVMFNTLTFAAGERSVDLGNVSFDRGLYAVIGGTADLTLTID